MSTTVTNAGPSTIPGPSAPTNVTEDATDSQQPYLATPSNPNTVIEDDLLVSKRKRELEREDSPPGEGTETEPEKRAKRSGITSLPPNSIPSFIKTPTAQKSSHSTKSMTPDLMEPRTQPTQADSSMSSPNPSSRPYPKHPSPVSHRSNASVPSRTSFRNHTPVSAPNSRPPSQPPSGASSPIDRVAPIHLPSPLPPSGPPSRPASPRHNYSTPSNPDLAFPFMYPYPVNPPIQSLSIFTPQMPGQHRGIPQPPQEHEYRTNRQPQRRLDSVPVAPHPQTESIVYPQPSVFQDVIPNASHFLNGVPHDHSGVSSPFIQEPASGQFVGPFFALPTAQVPQNQFQTGRQGRPKQERSSPNIAHVPPRKGTHSVTIERHADILLDFINTKVEFGIKNSQLIKQAESTLLASLRDHVDGGKGSTKQSCEKAVGTDEDQVIETAAEELLTHTVKEESKPIHRTFVAQAGAWAEERRLLIKRQQELEEEKRVAEERRVADAEQVSKERKEYTSKVEYLSSKVKELQENLAAMHHAEISRKPSGSG